MDKIVGVILCLLIFGSLFAYNEQYQRQCEIHRKQQEDSLALHIYSQGYTQGFGRGLQYKHDTTGMRKQIMIDFKEFSK